MQIAWLPNIYFELGTHLLRLTTLSRLSLVEGLEKYIMLKRASIVLLALLLLPGLALAQSQTRATFFVGKLFTDGNPGEVDVTLSCNTGLPLNQTKSIAPLISASDYVDFVVTDFDEGEMDCDVTESAPAGYTPLYFFGRTTEELPLSLADAQAGEGQQGFGLSDEGCFFEDVPNEENAEGDLFCLVINYPDPVEVSITKDWVIEGEHLNGVSTDYRVSLVCDGPIVSANNGGHIKNIADPLATVGAGLVFWNWNGSADETFIAEVRPDSFGSNNCQVFETVFDSAVEVDNNCGSIDIDVGNDVSCTIVNTVFFEGIPTLSQYGLAILVLLMAGVGFVGFRRFA
ncbi:IPTL-CTERM sorting domain-containing protein [Elongatibacter sediminis]|uniref:IPTL-CTERM sorting domain-containing protein n=1 Tax=Elongatibacter sediminis TaxID=3119006 RepID=A0AAW9RN48_9GAMM